MPSDHDEFWEELGQGRRGRRARAAEESKAAAARERRATDEPPPPTGPERYEAPARRRRATGASDERPASSAAPAPARTAARSQRPRTAAPPAPQVPPRTPRAPEPRGRRLAIAASATAAVWVGLMLIRLFAGGAVGVADQGDGQQLTCGLGVAPTQPFGIDPRAHVWPTYHAQQWAGESCGAPNTNEQVPSSERWLLSAAKTLTGPLGLPGKLDLRALGILAAALVGLGVGAWVLALPGPLAHRIAVASLVGLVYADSTVAPWFVSAYAEPAAMLGILFLAPALLWLWRRERSGWAELVAVGALAMFTIMAKAETVALVPAIVLGLLWTRSSARQLPAPDAVEPADRSAPWNRRVAVFGLRWRDRLSRFTRTRVVALGVAVAVVVGAGAYLHAQPGRLALQRKYDAFFSELIPHSPSGGGDIKHFGLPKGDINASGTTLTSPGSLARTRDFDTWNSKVSMPGIWLTYARDPFRLVDLGTRGMHAVGAGRTNYLGNRMANDAGNLAHDDRVPIFLTIFRAFDRFLPLLALVWVLTLGWGYVAAKAEHYSPAERGLGRFAVVLVLAITCEFWWVLLDGGSAELVKNMELTQLLTALCFPTMLALRLAARRQRVSA